VISSSRLLKKDLTKDQTKLTKHQTDLTKEQTERTKGQTDHTKDQMDRTKHQTNLTNDQTDITKDQADLMKDHTIDKPLAAVAQCLVVAGSILTTMVACACLAAFGFISIQRPAPLCIRTRISCTRECEQRSPHLALVWCCNELHLYFYS
jgi:ABC-type transport system involved in cytochrome bd biosynthesis fused ATPase/permease subunit